jgi:ribulose-5-phosphate 4-epimerase/fuculose-1-phosphate aldolase
MATVLSASYVPDAASLELRERLALALRILHREGYNDHVLGHVTMRQPRSDYVWTNGWGIDWEVIQPEDMVLIDWDMNVVHGRLNPNTALAFHLRIYERRPDVQCIVHNHPIWGTPFSSLGRPLRMLEQTSCIFFEDHALHLEYGGIAFNTGEDAAIAASLGEKRVAILRNHGVIIAGASLEEVVTNAFYLERTCRLNCLAADWPDVKEIPDDVARSTHDFYMKGRLWHGTWQAMVETLRRLAL